MNILLINGILKDPQGNPINNVKVQTMKSDQKWFEDHYDDIIDSKWVNDDGTFETSFDKEKFKEGLLEGLLKENPHIYLIIRNSSGQIIKRTETKQFDNSNSKNIYFDITLNSLEKLPTQFSSDPYTSNNERVIAAFEKLNDVSEFQLNDILRIFGLLIRSIDAWSLYTSDYMWKIIGYDGPQVPKYPWREQHSHKLSWE